MFIPLFFFPRIFLDFLWILRGFMQGFFEEPKTSLPTSAAPYPVRPARPWPYLDFEKEKAAAAAAARRHYRGLKWLGLI